MIQEVEGKTEFRVEVVQVGALENHPNGDTLAITNVNGYPVIVKRDSFKEGDLAVYVPVDSVVPTDKPEFSFLFNGKSTHRVKAIRLRGIFSMGLLVPAPAGVAPGQDMAEAMGITKYVTLAERKMESLEGQRQNTANARKAKAQLKLPVYGLDALRKYSHAFLPGEEVVVTEKIHGTNARFCFEKGRLWVGSHKMMRGASPSRLEEWFTSFKLKLKSFLGFKHRAHLEASSGDVWWKCVEQYGLKEKLAKKPGFVLYGEIYGEGVQDLVYDSPKGRKFRAFDVYDLNSSKFLDYDDFVNFIDDIGLDSVSDVVPLLTFGQWDDELAKMLKSQVETSKSTLNPKQIMEGFVIKPTKERTHNHVGRVAQKFISEAYLLRAEKKD